MNLCEHTKLKTTHTCSINGKIFYCVFCLWKATNNLKPIGIYIEHFKSLKNIVWNNITALDALNPEDDPKKKHHYNRIINADLKYPILVKINHSKCIILDGCHRYAKARILEQKIINCIIVSDDILNRCIWKQI